ncbi:MAG TPA: polyphosphate:AMP phosphotransferase [Magnetospirillaceae bacterium]|nr:polyphosphate:AMP phosphotransferase [Magnetospirillaceae bacterium]
MFETAELGVKISREEFDSAAGKLRLELLALQQKLREADFPVILLFAGVDGAGKTESVNLLNEWLDPHWIVTRAYEDPSEEERERPSFWRYWRDLPKKGQIGAFLSGWYSRPLLDRVYRRTGEADFDYRLDHIAAFERLLADDGALILKFWMHLDKKGQKKRLEALEADPLLRWKVTKQDWRNRKRYGKFIAAAEHLIRRTDLSHARWILVDGSDERFRSLAVLRSLHDALKQHLAERKRKKPAAKKPATPAIKASVLSALDMSQALDKDAYERELHEARAELAVLARQAHGRGISSVTLFEGWDAAGKGGAIRRVASALDARHREVVSVAAPTDEEKAQHYLWRFWRHLPRAGHMLIYDRSWYGRVLVERVEGFARPEEWQRAYAEINDFEDQLWHHGMVLTKFWLHITPEEQYKRFEQRDAVAYKKWKLTDEDWRNRSKWDSYEAAVHEMVERTSSAAAPWLLIEGNDKNFARVKVIRALADRLRVRLARP